jgi:hypothetical protein
MTQIRMRPAGTRPATHVLVIGVGYYRHLLDGPEPRKKGVHLGLSVLESPTLSAEKFARWVLGTDGSSGHRLNNPTAPLATVEVLISSRNPVSLEVDGRSYVVERATLAAVRAGFDRWIEEVKSSEANVGVIYFCGHGITGNGSEHYLLVDDHGAVANRPFETGSFDITTTVRALWRVVRAQLYVFIDACRTSHLRLADNMGAKPAPLLQEGASTKYINQGTTRIEAAGEGLPAYGDSNDVSRFTEALLRALNGYSGVPQAGTKNWLVNGEALSQAMPKLLGVVSRERKYYIGKGDIQSCSPERSGPSDVPLHVRVEPPNVKVEIEITPEEFQTHGDFTMKDLVFSSRPPLTGGRTTGVWRTEAPRGTYAIRVFSEAKVFQDFDSGAQSVDPPTYRLPVELQP